MATKYPNNLEITVEQPADTRFSAKDIAERDSFKYLYSGLLTYVRGKKKFYYYDGVWKGLKDLEVGSGTAISNTKDVYKHTATDGNDISITLGEMEVGIVKEVLLLIDNASSKTINLTLPNDNTAIFINNMDEMYVAAESTSEFSFLIDTTGGTPIIRVAGLIKE